MNRTLTQHLQRAIPGALEWLRRMVAVNSFTTNKEGVERVSALTADGFANLGFVPERVASLNAGYGQHLVLTRPGTSGRKIGLVSHLDTVFTPEEELRHEFSWREDGDRIFGPGTMDIKGGTVMIHLVLSALKAIAPAAFDEITWIILQNSSEEVLSRDFGQLCLERLQGPTLAALVFEAGGRKGGDMSVVTSRKGRATFHIQADGRGAHAGTRHQRGANAVVQLAEVVGRIAALTDYSRDLTFNPGTFLGGTVVNRVPHFAAGEVEMRAFTRDTYLAGMKSIMALNDHSSVVSEEGGHRCRVTVRVTAETPPWPSNEGTERIFGLWQHTAAEAGLKMVGEARGGVSDGNYIWHAFPTIDGLGPYGDNAHCSEHCADGSKEQEYVEISSFAPRATVSALAILRLLATAP